jgi:hypothetical protein
MHYFIEISQFKEQITAESTYIDITIGSCFSGRIYLSKQKTGFGYKHFMICQKCNTRHTELFYYEKSFICRKCYPENIYYEIQHRAKGGNKYIAYIMRRYAEKIGIAIKRFPFCYEDYEKPKYRKDKWVNDLKVLQALEDMRYQTIAYNKRWSNKTIKSVLTWNNLSLYWLDIWEIQDRCIRIMWEQGEYNLKDCDKSLSEDWGRNKYDR